jgi:tetratricopeptide (TPR) repeat protein
MANAEAPILDAIKNTCDHLVERAATLFLGAGVNAGATNASGQKCPLGPELGERICRDLLNSPETQTTLDEAVEMARYRVGAKAVNDYIYDALKPFRPGASHLALVQLPWDVIYTTNFDLIVEEAAESGLVESAGEFRTVLTTAAPLSSFTESDILYYKLHGSIDFANTEDGRLILTKADYRFYELWKRPLFRRLRTDLQSRSFLFVGYSLLDPNFRAILDDCRSELIVRTFPLSFAVQRDFSAVQEAFWREKYNIQLLKADATEFLVTLKDTWFGENCKVVPFLERKAVEYLNLDSTTRFQKAGDSFYLLRPSDCTGPSNPSAFFRGAEPSWADIRDKVAPHRDAYESLFEAVFPDIADPLAGPSALLVTGSAGTGKTALVRSLAYDVAYAFGTPVFIHIAGTPLDTRVLTPLMNAENPQRFVVIVDFAGECLWELNLFWEEMRQKKLPITLLLEERKNQWAVSKNSVPTQLNPTEFELGNLSEGEISRILDALERHGCLDKLTGVPHEEQVSHFTALAHEDLLVALRELTTNNSFDKIVANEFEKIPSPAAKEAYLHVSAVGQLDLAIRYETLIRTLHLRYDQLGPEVLRPTEGVLLSGEETGSSRHNVGFRLRARHPIIASIIFALAAPDDAKKFEVLNGLLSNLDPAFPEDLRLLNEITKRRELVNTFAEHAMRRAVYERIAAILPGNGYVYQHRSIAEREMRDAGQAVQFARAAVRIDPKNGGFQNTLGLALEFAARDVGQDDLKRQALLSEASKLFEDGIRRNRDDPYGYIGLLNILKQKVERGKGKEEREELVVSELSLLEDAYEATLESPMIAGELAKIKEQLGSLDNALAIVRRAAKKNPRDMRLQQLLIQFSEEKGDPQEALKIAVEAAKSDPTSWRIQLSIARLRKTLNGTMQSVRGHFEAAIRFHKGDVGLVVELGAYLFTQGSYDEAKKTFETVGNLSLSGQDRNKIREVWKDSSNRPRVFEGKIHRLAGATGTVVAIPENFEAFFWRSTGNSLLRVGYDVQFTVAFSAQGASARNIRQVK